MTNCAWIVLTLVSTHVFASVEIPQISPPHWIVPAKNIPHKFKLRRSNNNDSIAMHEGRLFVAWRSAPTHFASKKTKMFVMSSSDMGETWLPEHEISLRTDVREPFLISFQGRLFLSYFIAGSNPLAFQPKKMMRTERLSQGRWSRPEEYGLPGEVPWEIKERNGQLYMTSYLGDHYSSGKSKINVFFKTSKNGIDWAPVNPNTPFVYEGGVSEVGFEFTENGKLWAVTRNEDGDNSRWGSHVATSENWGKEPWVFPKQSNPNRYDSPRMVRHGKDLYLVARKDLGGPYDQFKNLWGFNIQKWLYLISYSLRYKQTALYTVNQETREVEWLADLPSAGDTAFPSIVQLGPDKFMVANYTSPINETYEYSWFDGQVSRRGTGIYWVEMNFANTSGQ